MLWNQALCLASCKLYLHYCLSSVKLSSHDVWAGITVLETVMFLSSVGFIKNINPNYRITFISTKTGKQFACDWWGECKEDSKRIEIFQFHPDLWSGIYSDVEDWVKFNFERWMDEREEWLDGRVLATVPKEFTAFYYARDDERAINDVELLDVERRMSKDSLKPSSSLRLSSNGIFATLRGGHRKVSGKKDSARESP